jgi:hypothetical protein
MYLGGKMKSFIVLFILTAVLTLSAVQTETRNFRTFLYGNDSNFTYNNWLSHVSEATISPNGDIYAPFDRQLNNFGGYDTGTSYLNIWESAVDNFCNGNFDQAHQILTDATLPFEVVQMIDTATNRDYYVLREIPDMSFVDNNDTPNVEYDDEIGAFVKGWGLAVYNPYSSNSVVISVVQPGDDFITVPLAFEAFEKTDARYLLINGAGREVNPDYSDPSRNNSHPFNRIYRSACDEIRSTFGRREFSLQLHSFDYNNNLPVDVLLSSGRARPTGLPIYDFSSHHFDIAVKGTYSLQTLSGIHLLSKLRTILQSCRFRKKHISIIMTLNLYRLLFATISISMDGMTAFNIFILPHLLIDIPDKKTG